MDIIAFNRIFDFLSPSALIKGNKRFLAECVRGGLFEGNNKKGASIEGENALKHYLYMIVGHFMFSLEFNYELSLFSIFFFQ